MATLSPFHWIINNSKGQRSLNTKSDFPFKKGLESLPLLKFFISFILSAVVVFIYRTRESNKKDRIWAYMFIKSKSYRTLVIDLKYILCYSPLQHFGLIFSLSLNLLRKIKIWLNETTLINIFADLIDQNLKRKFLNNSCLWKTIF